MLHITPRQLRAARVLIGWSATDLASQSGAGIATISRLENADGLLPLSRLSVRSIVRALTDAGVVFIDHSVDPSVEAGVAIRRVVEPVDGVRSNGGSR